MADDTYTVERSTSIAAPPERIYPKIADFHRWTAWSPWEDADPDLKPYSGAGSGQGQMKITEATEPSRVAIDLAFEKPWKARNDTSFTITPAGAGSHVSWSMTDRKTLLTKVMEVFRSMDTMLGPDFEKPGESAPGHHVLRVQQLHAIGHAEIRGEHRGADDVADQHRRELPRG